MKKEKRKIITQLLIIGFFISTFFACILVSQSFSMVHDDHSVAVSACCDGESMLGISNHNMPLILRANTSLQLLLLSFVIVYLFIKDYRQIREDVLKYYFRICDFYGGFKRFCYFISLFSQGILHPKLY